MSLPISFSVILAAALFSTAAANADVIWSDDFTGHPDNTFPTRDFTGNSTNDWSNLGTESMLRVSTSLGNPSPGLVFTDNSTAMTGGLGNLRLQMSEFATFSTANPATPMLRLSFDLKVESFLSSATAEAFRFILRANSSSASGDQLIIGFNRASLNDGDGSTTDLTLYAATAATTSNIPPSNTSAIGLIAETGWQPGFNFGEYDGGNSTANDTDDLFYHFDFGYDFVTGMVNGTVTRMAPDATNGQSAPFAVALNPGLVFSNTDMNDVVLIASTNGVTGTSQFDNFVIESVPEPGSAAMLLLGAAATTARRRRRS